ncbi:MAG: helix-turn-helix transcriptional regulator [Pseudobdellovibrionaceae bacterium]
MRTMHKNQQLILKYLLNHPEGATLEELASHIELTKTAVKEHILKIENLGYLTFIDTKGSVGRPRRRYLLSSEGHDVFPKQYSWLSNILLELLAQEMGGEGVADLMKSLANRVAKTMQPKFENIESTADLLAKINSVMNELGYQTILKQSDIRKGAILEATNCVYHSVAKQHPELCGFDIQFLENISGMKVKLESCIARNGSVCRFCFRK